MDKPMNTAICTAGAAKIVRLKKSTSAERNAGIGVKTLMIVTISTSATHPYHFVCIKVSVWIMLSTKSRKANCWTLGC